MSGSYLLDGNVLIALLIEDHVHNEAARRWLRESGQQVASCPITQGAVVRTLLRAGLSGSDAHAVLSGLLAQPSHVFWPDDLSYADVPLTGVVGHRQVSDAYLAQLARRRGGRLATFDKGLAALHADVAELLPIS